MVSLTKTWVSGETLTASDINTNFQEVVTLLSTIGNDQLNGGITSDKLSDNHGVSWSNFTLLPHSGDPADYSAVTEIALPATMTTFLKFAPIMKAGIEGYLCGIIIYCANRTAAAGASPGIQFLLNGSTTIGGQAIELTTDDQLYLVAYNDPITNPLATLSDGNYITVQMGSYTGANNPTAAGVYVSFAMKYKLTSG